MKKRLLSALLTFCMVLTLLPVSAFAVDTKDLRDTELHIMDISGLKQLVAEQSNVDAEDVTIHGVFAPANGLYGGSNIDPSRVNTLRFFVENVFVMTEERASHQDIRPLKIGILKFSQLVDYGWM